MSLFLLKNSFGSKMKKGFIRNFCNGESSTSTLDQQKVDHCGTAEQNPVRLVNSPSRDTDHDQATLEEMILKLEMGRKGGLAAHGRMSCVNSSDILRRARNALNQYPPRFSLDGKDAMYRCSFTNNNMVDDPITTIRAAAAGKLPCVIGGESVVWCKPGVVPKLMGLDAMPIPFKNSISSYRRERVSAIIRKQNLRRRAQTQSHEKERRKLMMADKRMRDVVGSCSRIMNPAIIDLEIPNGEAPGWPIRRFL